MTKEEMSINDLLDAIEKMIGIKVQNLPFDRSYIGIVKSVINANTFQIEYDGATRKFVTKNTPNIKVGSTVHIVHPRNDITARYLLEDIKHPS